jgi:hypothetical protein
MDTYSWFGPLYPSILLTRLHWWIQMQVYEMLPEKFVKKWNFVKKCTTSYSMYWHTHTHAWARTHTHTHTHKIPVGTAIIIVAWSVYQVGIAYYEITSRWYTVNKTLKTLNPWLNIRTLLSLCKQFSHCLLLPIYYFVLCCTNIKNHIKTNWLCVS